MSQRAIKWRQVRHHWEIYLFILPTLILIGLFQYYPASSGILHSFYRWNGADIAEWVGWKNYKDLLFDASFWRSFRVALIIGLWNIVKMIPALMVAVCIHRCRSTRMQFVYRGLFVIPMVIPGLVVVLIWRNLFFDPGTGLLNRFLYDTGLMSLLSWLDQTFNLGGMFVGPQPPAWVGDPKLLLVACIIWGFPWVGSFAVLTHLAKLQGISKDVYEAADIDGISWWSKFVRIELPLIASSIYLLLVFVIIETIKDAGTVLALANIDGGPGGVVTVPALFMLRKAFISQEMGAACAVGIVLTLVVLSLQKLSNLISNWKDLMPRTQTITRIAMIAVGCAAIWFNFLGVVGAALILLFLPWSYIMSLIPRNERAETIDREKLRVIESRIASRFQKSTQPGAIFRKRAEEFLLRAAKHGAIWVILLFSLLPLYLMLVVSPKSNAQFYQNPMVPTAPFHWGNWVEAWNMVTPSLANSYFVSFSATILTLFLALGAAYFFARYKMPLSGILWNAILILMMLPAIANLVPLFQLLRDMSLLNTLTALILVGTSAGQVFAIFVLRSFVADIPHDLFEAAEIDGASHFRQMMMIVLPLSGPILGTIGVMRFIAEWNDFVLPLIVMRDQIRLPVMVQLLRLAGEYQVNWGPLMAGYALASLPIIALFLMSMKLFVKGLTEGATKG